MHEERTADTPERAVDQAIFALLIDSDIQRPWSQHELELEIGSDIEVEDSLSRLRGAGLVHRCGEFTWPTRAALRAQELSG